MAAPEAEEKAAAPPSSGLSPKEEGELEDGEISDDDNPEGPPEPTSRGGGPRGPYARRRPPPDIRGGLPLASSRRFPHLRHQAPPELGHLHSHGGGYRLKEAFRPHPPQPPPCSRLPPGSHPDSGPRLSFWERSHNALDRFRFRGRPYRGGGRWGRSRGGNPPGRPPGGGSGSGGYGGSQAWREPSPRKCILVTWASAWRCGLLPQGMAGGVACASGRTRVPSLALQTPGSPYQDDPVVVDSCRPQGLFIECKKETEF
uniref:Uncharacterized protein n=1 Tax=Sphaerodactylus townsendi TaxID=933632 RepID=A0ACB8FNT1_9SAUR